MAQQIINIGTVANDGTGDPLRSALNKANANFTELYPSAEAVAAASSGATLADANKLAAFDAFGSLVFGATPVLDLAHAIDRRIIGKNPATDRAIYSVQTHTGPAQYTRSAACWAASIDLTCVSPWNSDSGAEKAGTLISPRHILFAHHFLIANGATIRFITKDNVIVERTMTNSLQVGSTDIRIGVLDSDVPDTISFARVLPASYADYVNLIGKPVLYTDAEEKAHIKEIDLLTATFANAATLRTPTFGDRADWHETVVGSDSGNPVMLVIGNMPVLLGSFFSATEIPLLSNNYAAIEAVMTTLGGGYGLTPIEISFLHPTIHRWSDIVEKPDFGSASLLDAAVEATSGQVVVVGLDGKIHGGLVSTGSTAWGDVTGKPFTTAISSTDVGDAGKGVMYGTGGILSAYSSGGASAGNFVGGTGTGVVVSIGVPASAVAIQASLNDETTTGTAMELAWGEGNTSYRVLWNGTVQWLGSTATAAVAATRVNLAVPAVQTKADTGDPAAPTGSEPTFCINTFDNNFKVYADGAWRTLTTW